MKSLSDPALVQNVVQRIRLLPFGAPARWGKMNAHQMLCHLTDSFLGVMGQRPIGNRAGLLGRTVMKFGALYFPMEWPKGVPTMPEVDQFKGGTPPTEWDADRERLLRTLTLFVMPATVKAGHPIFGPLTEEQWLRWAYLHCDHHLRQFGA